MGSNLGERAEQLRAARAALDRLPLTRLVAASSLYLTEPVGVPQRFARQFFLNQVLVLATELALEPFATRVMALEKELGRRRDGEANAPRLIDIDIIAFGCVQQSDPHLILPHPRAHLRRFVLQPLAELRPALRLPGFTESVAQLLAALPALEACRPAAEMV